VVLLRVLLFEYQHTHMQESRWESHLSIFYIFPSVHVLFLK
jgi:hypothetical protein